jgi:hypothetical protein
MVPDVLKRFKPEEPSLSSSNDGKSAIVEDEDDLITTGVFTGTEAQRADVSEESPQGDYDDGDDEGRFFGGGLNDEQNVC